MLSTAITPFKQQLFSILTGEEVKTAFTKAMMASLPAAAMQGDAEDTSKQCCQQCGEMFAAYFGAIAKPLAEAIDTYIKQAGITLKSSGTLIANTSTGSGPVNGVATPEQFSIS